MKMLRVRAKNFLSHKDTEVNMNGYDSVVVLGPNGSGKSSLIVDAPMVALFGKGRSGNLDGYVRNGADLMTVEHDFEVNDTRYRVIRKRSVKTSRGETALEFYQIDRSGEVVGNPLTQGSIAETQALIIKTLGIDFDTIVRTSMIEQGEADYFCRATPSERMDLFSKVWDLERYDDFAQIARDDSTALKEKLKGIDEKTVALDKKLKELEQSKGMVSDLQKQVALLDSEVARIEKDKVKIEKSILEYKMIDKDLVKAKALRETLQSDLKAIGLQFSSLIARIERYRKIIKNRDVVMAKVEEEKECEKKISEAESEKKLIVESISALHSQIRDERKEADDRIFSIDVERVSYQKEVEVQNKKKMEANVLSIGIGKMEERLKGMMKDASKLEGIQCHPDYDPSYVNETCRFIKDAVIAKSEIPGTETKIALDRQAAGLIISEAESAMEALSVKIASCDKRIDVIKRQFSEKIFSIEGKEKGFVRDVKGLDDKLSGLKTSLSDIKRYTVLVSEISLAEKELPGMLEEEKVSEEKSRTVDNDLKKASDEIAKIEEQMKGKSALDSDLQSTCNLLSRKSRERDEALKRFGSLETDVGRIPGTIEELKNLRNEAESVESQRAIKLVLEEAFRSIPYMLVSRGIWVVEKIANDILTAISTNGLRVHIETEKMTKTTKKVRDEIRLVFQDLDGEKGYTFLSGGEKLRAALSLRLAISETLAHRRGMRVDSLIADEPFGPLDVEGIEEVKGAMQELRKRFRFMAVITHVDRAQDIFPAKLIFKKESGETKVEVVNE